MAWRWRFLMPNEGFEDAMKTYVSTKSKEMIKKNGNTISVASAESIAARGAAEYVIKNRAEFGLPVVPFEGYCGLAGVPSSAEVK